MAARRRLTARAALTCAALGAGLGLAGARGVAARTCAAPAFRREDPAWRRGAPPVAHALGTVDGRALTNSGAAFRASHAAGYRVLEVDLAFTADDSLVATHAWTDGWRRWRALRPRWSSVTARDRRDGPLLDAAALVALLREHPDAWLVLDPKDDLARSLRRVVAAARAAGDPAVLDRVVPQLYHRCDADVARAVHPWRATILTLYRTADDDAAVARFVRASGVTTVTASAGRFSPALAAALARDSVAVYVHTVNDHGAVARLRAAGAAGVYTDLARPPEP